MANAKSVKIKRTTADFLHGRDRSISGVILTDRRQQYAERVRVCVQSGYICIGVEQMSVAGWDRQPLTSVSVAFYHHAKGVALSQQNTPFEDRTHPAPIAPPSSSAGLQHSTLTGAIITFPCSKHESSVFRQNHVRRLQRSSKERSRVHPVRQEPSPQTGQWVILGNLYRH